MIGVSLALVGVSLTRIGVSLPLVGVALLAVALVVAAVGVLLVAALVVGLVVTALLLVAAVATLTHALILADVRVTVACVLGFRVCGVTAGVVAGVLRHGDNSWFRGHVSAVLRVPRLLGGRRWTPSFGIDRAARPELPRVQCRRRLEDDLDITVGLPSLVTDEVLKVTGERLDRQVPIRSEGVVIGFTDGDDVTVGSQGVATIELLDAAGSLLLEGGFHLLGDHAATEDACERIADRRLQLAFEALCDTHGNPLSGLQRVATQMSLLHGIHFSPDSIERIPASVPVDTSGLVAEAVLWP